MGARAVWLSILSIRATSLRRNVAKLAVLLVESDPKQLKLLAASLEQDGYQVLTAGDGEAALATLSHHAPDLIIAATALTRLDGYALVEQVKADVDLADIPVLLMTEGQSRADKIRALEVGVDECLSKPVFVKELLSRARMLLAKQVRERLSVTGSGAPVSGSLSDLAVIDLLEALSRAGQTAVVHLAWGAKRRSEAREGEIYLRKGSIVDAELKQLRGEEAVFRLLGWTEGRFEVEITPVTRPASVELSTRKLLDAGVRHAAECAKHYVKLPSLEELVVVDHDGLAESMADVPEALADLLALCDGTRTLHDVVDESPFDDMSTLATLSRLADDELLHVAKDPRGREAAPARGRDASSRPPAAARGASERPLGRAGRADDAGDDGADAGEARTSDADERLEAERLDAERLEAERAKQPRAPVATDRQPFGKQTKLLGSGVVAERLREARELARSGDAAATEALLAVRAEAQAAKAGLAPESERTPPMSEKRSELGESGVSQRFFASEPPPPSAVRGEFPPESENDVPRMTEEQLARRKQSLRVVSIVVGVLGAFILFFVVKSALSPSSSGANSSGASASGAAASRAGDAPKSAASPTNAPSATSAATVAASAPAPSASAAEIASASAAESAAPLDTAAPTDDRVPLEIIAHDGPLPEVADPLKAATAKLNSGACKDAIPLAKAAIKKDPENADGYMNLVWAYECINKYKDAAPVKEACGRLATKGANRGYCPKPKK